MVPFRVLVADADPVFLATCRLVLAESGVDLRTAACLAGCREVVRREPLDLLVVDGELLQTGTAEGLAGVPLIVMVEPPLAGRPLPAGAFAPGTPAAVIVKPVCPAALAGVIKAVAAAAPHPAAV